MIRGPCAEVGIVLSNSSKKKTVTKANLNKLTIDNLQNLDLHFYRLGSLLQNCMAIFLTVV